MGPPGLPGPPVSIYFINTNNNLYLLSQCYNKVHMNLLLNFDIERCIDQNTNILTFYFIQFKKPKPRYIQGVFSS